MPDQNVIPLQTASRRGFLGALLGGAAALATPALDALAAPEAALASYEARIAAAKAAGASSEEVDTLERMREELLRSAAIAR